MKTKKYIIRSKETSSQSRLEPAKSTHEIIWKGTQTPLFSCPAFACLLVYIAEAHAKDK